MSLRDVDDDVRQAAKRWSRDIERELGHAEVEVDADSTPAKKEIDKLEREKHTAQSTRLSRSLWNLRWRSLT